jgi:hypothetical protein
VNVTPATRAWTAPPAHAIAVEWSAVEAASEAERERGLLWRPVALRNDGGAVTAALEAWVRRPLATLAPALDPRTWPSRSTLFAETRKVEQPADPGPAGRTSWRGRVLEVFRLDVGPLRLNEFEVLLDFDVSVVSDRVRTDYALVCERDDKLRADDGYLEARKVPGHPGWTHVRCAKTVEFASAVSNFLAPAALMLLVWIDAGRFLRAPGPQAE